MTRKGKWPGTWAVICQSCGFRFPSSEIQKRWDGLLVCKNDLESRHPQTMIRVRGESAVPAFVSHPPDVYIPYCDVATSSSYADVGTADCMRADNSTVPYQTVLDINGNGHTI